ncbi:uncharacterized protein H6S33_009075 [Morchella sextelata]|uniref:uncharacterized protein n=1 Tax=Morchella sextelata TaxID=1174677 RepID=UPI001D03BFEC|nr:uncharacterized protein H6S33_009075 [Morchella sextelata]KAH0612695.1 hypothetical protein H6S33_009075 [Morchella sextelata]
MLSIKTSSKPAKCNLLPCQIKYTGPTDATEKHWVVTEGSGEDEPKSASFRGRKLAGKSFPVPEGYEGHILEATEERLQSEDQSSTPPIFEEELDVNIFKGLCTFDEITIWGHDAIPDKSNDSVVRGIDEWIEFANKIHSFEEDDVAEKATH